MKKSISIILIFLGFALVAQSQSANETILINWLKSISTDSTNFIRVQSLMKDFDYPIKNKLLTLNDGNIYQFNDVRSHAQKYLFVYKNKTIEIITDYSFHNILRLYWTRANTIKKKSIKLKLLEGLTNLLYQRGLVENHVD